MTSAGVSSIDSMYFIVLPDICGFSCTRGFMNSLEVQLIGGLLPVLSQHGRWQFLFEISMRSLENEFLFQGMQGIVRF